GMLGGIGSGKTWRQSGIRVTGSARNCFMSRLIAAESFRYAMPVCGVYPARADRVDPYPVGQADGQRVCQGQNAAFGRRIALCIRLGLESPGGGDVDDGRTRLELGEQKAGEQIWRGDANLLH